jgi:alkaline phosphatase
LRLYFTKISSNEEVNSMKKIFFSVFCLSLLHNANAAPKSKNLIYFIGDGMGPAQITGARIYQGGANHKLHLEELEYTGFSKTYSTTNYVTESAAAATTLATGVKTYDGSIGMSDPSLSEKGSEKLETIFSLAKKQGKSVGIISTARITHATPAAFYAYARNRDEEDLIAEQLLTSNFDLFLGGGREHFLGPDDIDPLNGLKGKRHDKKNLVQVIKDNKEKNIYLETGSEFKKLNPQVLYNKKKNALTKVVGLFNLSHMEFDLLRPAAADPEPSLTEMVDFAISFLGQNPKGYMLMVEAGKIDHAAHDNRAKLVFTELLAMDLAIARAIKERKASTLVVVTADHETGGLALQGYGPSGIKGETLLGNKRRVDGTFDEKNNYLSWSSGPGADVDTKFNDKEPAPRQKALYKADSAYHTAVDVMVGASGPCADKFRGFMENSEIPQKISECMGLNLKAYLK